MASKYIHANVEPKSLIDSRLHTIKAQSLVEILQNMEKMRVIVQEFIKHAQDCVTFCKKFDHNYSIERCMLCLPSQMIFLMLRDSN